MKYYSTNKKSSVVDFKNALLRGLAPDGGLYMPSAWPRNQKSKIKNQKFGDILKYFVDIPEKDLKNICDDAFNFPAPLVKLDKYLYILELFHGPTLSFKDFGARFMARAMNYYVVNSKQEIVNRKGNFLNIIVATSGDTGSAVVSGFYGLPNIKVFVLYPSGRVSNLQEKQIATFGKNIVVFEVRGDFDDCQRLAKLALGDAELRKKINPHTKRGVVLSARNFNSPRYGVGVNISSANSINIGRLLPQMYYYFWGHAQLSMQRGRTSQKLAQCQEVRPLKTEPVFVVPSGNFGNLAAGLFAKKLGLPAKKFIAAVNINSGVPEYLKTGSLPANKSRKTLSSAMDVGNPSNWARVIDLYRDQSRINADRSADLRRKIKKDLEAIVVTDAETKKTIRDIYKKYDYIIDPHTAVGVAAALKSKTTGPKIVLATAHPAKFREIVEEAIGKKIKLPPQLAKVWKKKKRTIIVRPDYENLLGKLIHS